MVQFTGLDLKHVTMANLTSYNKRIRRIADYYILQIKGGGGQTWPGGRLHVCMIWPDILAEFRDIGAQPALTSAAMR